MQFDCRTIASTLLVVLSLLSGVPREACAADALAEIRARGVLRWGGDQEGGGPFVYPDPQHPEKLRGFEVELAEMLAGELGVKAEFVQGQWDKLPLLLGRTIDVVLNGFELTPTRSRDYLCTRPYFQYGLQLLARDDSKLQSWDDLAAGKAPQPWRVGVLVGSAAETFWQQAIPPYNVQVATYDGSTDAMEQVSSGVLDATLQDDCVAQFYADRFPRLKFIGRPVAGGYYVALVARDQPQLHSALNAALGKLIADGRLKALYDRWDLAGRAQMLALRKTAEVHVADDRSIWEIIRANLPMLLQAAGVTVFLSVVSMPLAVALGLLIAIGRLFGPRLLAVPLAVYVELVRGTPLMLQLYAIFFLLPQLGIELQPLVAAIAGLAINYSAYEAEIYRAGFQAVPRGQMEAALALGMTRGQAIRRILLPQAFRMVIPPVTNDFIALFKDTSVCSVVTVVELTKRYSVLALSTGAIVELAAITAVLYMLMSYPLSLLAHWSEQRMASGSHK